MAPQLITDARATKLRAHKYNGSDASLLYHYALSPLAAFCVEAFTPLWMAPNLITVLGLLPSVIMTAVAATYAPTLDGTTPPAWVCYATAAAVFFYSTMDNMDGKQARRTGSSSPLGTLFDHGLDAVNAAFVSWQSIAIILGAKARTWQLVSWWLVPNFPFVVNIWEEFYTRNFQLVLINGPNEGLAICVVSLIATGYYGHALWEFDMLGASASTPVRAVAWAYAPFVDFMRWLGGEAAPRVVPSVGAWTAGFGGAPTGSVPFGDFLPVFFLLFVVGTVASQVVGVARLLLRRTDGSRTAVLLDAVYMLCILAFITGGSLAWSCMTETARIATEHPLLIYFAAGALSVELNARIIIGSLAGGDADVVFDSSLAARAAFFFAVPVLLRLGAAAAVGAQTVDDAAALAILVCFALSVVPAAHFFVNSTIEVKAALGVDLFLIKGAKAVDEGAGGPAAKKRGASVPPDDKGPAAKAAKGTIRALLSPQEFTTSPRSRGVRDLLALSVDEAFGSTMPQAGSPRKRRVSRAAK